MLLAVMLLVRVSVQVGEMATAEHIKVISKYIDTLTIIQQRIFNLALKIIF